MLALLSRSVTRTSLIYNLKIKVKVLGSLTNKFSPANFEKLILQRPSTCFNYYNIKT